LILIRMGGGDYQMEKIINTQKSLKRIKLTTFSLLVISSFFLMFDHTRAIGAIVMAVSLVAEWRWYRCPNCHKSLDPRINVDKNRYCPHCGKEI